MHRIDSDENSQSELLRDAEPIEYNDDISRLYNDLSIPVDNRSSLSYQSVQNTDWNIRGTRRTGVPPPRDIFDDV